MPIRLVSPHPPPLSLCLGPYWCPLGWPRGQGVPLFAQSGTIAIQSKAGRIAVAPHDRPKYHTRPPAIAHAGQHPQPQYVRATPPAGPSTCPPGAVYVPQAKWRPALRAPLSDVCALVAGQVFRVGGCASHIGKVTALPPSCSNFGANRARDGGDIGRPGKRDRVLVSGKHA